MRSSNDNDAGGGKDKVSEKSPLLKDQPNKQTYAEMFGGKREQAPFSMRVFIRVFWGVIMLSYIAEILYGVFSATDGADGLQQTSEALTEYKVPKAYAIGFTSFLAVLDYLVNVTVVSAKADTFGVINNLVKDEKQVVEVDEEGEVIDHAHPKYNLKIAGIVRKEISYTAHEVRIDEELGEGKNQESIVVSNGENLAGKKAASQSLVGKAWSAMPSRWTLGKGFSTGVSMINFTTGALADSIAFLRVLKYIGAPEGSIAPLTWALTGIFAPAGIAYYTALSLKDVYDNFELFLGDFKKSPIYKVFKYSFGAFVDAALKAIFTHTFRSAVFYLTAKQFLVEVVPALIGVTLSEAWVSYPSYVALLAGLYVSVFTRTKPVFSNYLQPFDEQSGSDKADADAKSTLVITGTPLEDSKVVASTSASAANKDSKPEGDKKQTATFKFLIAGQDPKALRKEMPLSNKDRFWLGAPGAFLGFIRGGFLGYLTYYGLNGHVTYTTPLGMAFAIFCSSAIGLTAFGHSACTSYVDALNKKIKNYIDQVAKEMVDKETPSVRISAAGKDMLPTSFPSQLSRCGILLAAISEKIEQKRKSVVNHVYFYKDTSEKPLTHEMAKDIVEGVKRDPQKMRKAYFKKVQEREQAKQKGMQKEKKEELAEQKEYAVIFEQLKRRWILHMPNKDNQYMKTQVTLTQDATTLLDVLTKAESGFSSRVMVNLTAFIEVPRTREYADTLDKLDGIMQTCTERMDAERKYIAPVTTSANAASQTERGLIALSGIYELLVNDWKLNPFLSMAFGIENVTEVGFCNYKYFSESDDSGKVVGGMKRLYADFRLFGGKFGYRGGDSGMNKQKADDLVKLIGTPVDDNDFANGTTEGKEPEGSAISYYSTL